MVHDEVGDDAQPALVGGVDEGPDVVDRAVVGVDLVVVGDVVAAVAQRAGVHRQQPDEVDAQPLQVVELLGQPAEVARAVGVAVEEAAQVDLVEDGLLEPEGIGLEPVARGRSAVAAASCRVHSQDVAGALARVQADVVAAHAPVVAARRRAGPRRRRRAGRRARRAPATRPSCAWWGSRLTTRDDRVGPLALGVGDDRVVGGVQEADVVQALQRGVLAADVVQALDHRQQRPVERALLELVLLVVEELLAARALDVLVVLVARVDAVARAQGGAQDEPDREGRRAALGQVVGEDVRRGEEEVGPEVLALLAVGELVDVLDQLPARSSSR